MNVLITTLVFYSVTGFFLEYGQCDTVLNPMQCFKTSDTKTECFVTSLTALDFCGVQIPNTTRDVNIHCVTENNNIITNCIFAKRDVQNLTFSNCFFSKFTSIVLRQLTSLHRLEFHWPNSKFNNNKNEPRINFGNKVICALKNVMHFAITQGEIKGIDEVIHCSLSPRCCGTLKSLNFRNNHIRSLNPGEFDGLNSLEILDLSFNYLYFLPKHGISKLPSLTRLILNGNQLSTISTALFQYNKFLKEISIIEVHSLVPYSFKDRNIMLSCQHLDYEDAEVSNRLTSFSVCVENISSSADQLLINLNSINQLTMMFLLKPDELTQTIPPFLNSTLTTLVNSTELSLMYEGPLYPKMFANLPSLQTLNLIISLHSFNISQFSLFDGLLQLKVLIVKPFYSSAPFSKEHTSLLAGALLGLPKLKCLRMNNMKLNSIAAKALEDLNSLNILDFNRNRLEYVPYCICNRKKASSLTEVYLSANTIQDLRRSDFQECQNLTVIDLSRNKLTSLCENSLTECQGLNGNTSDFVLRSLAKLTVLLLSNNKISAFDFSMVPQSLNRLDLSSNRISSLTDHNNIRCTMQLDTLNLENNKLFTFNSNSFPPSVSKLSLGNGDCIFMIPVKIDTNTFTNLKKLRNVTIFKKFSLNADRNVLLNNNTTRHMLTYFNIIGVPRTGCWGRIHLNIKVISYFNNFTLEYHYCQYLSESSEELRNGKCRGYVVNVLDCSRVGFHEFPRNFPSELAVERLYLDGNKFNALPSRAFFPLEYSVRVLYLNNSHISVIEENVFLYLERLEELHLENNELQNAGFVPFFALLNLQDLYLQNNHIISLDPKYRVKQLQNLPLSDKQRRCRDFNITEEFNKRLVFPYNFVGNIETLVLRNNSLQHIGFLQNLFFSSIIFIDLSYNNLKKIEPRNSSNLNNVNFFYIQENCITSLDGTEFIEMVKLLILHVNNNHINYVAPFTFRYQNLLQKLYLNHNLLSELRGNEFVGLDDLKILSLSNNNLSQIDNETFSELWQLQELDLSANKIANLSQNIFSKLKQLMRLYLSDNCIKITYDEFKPLVQLQELRLNHNLLSELKINSFENLKNLKELNLASNKLQMPRLWKLPTSINRVHIENNSLRCDCAFMRDFRDYLLNLGHHKVVNAKVITCMSVDKQEPINILKFDYSSVCKTSYELLLGLCATFMFMLLIVLSALYYWRLEVQVLVYSRYGMRFFSGHEEDDEKVYDVFICYSTEDEAFVMNDLLPGLKDYRICVYFKDFLPGTYLNENIVAAVEKSKRTLLVFSPRFVQSAWCKFEFKIAHSKSILDRRCRLLLLLLEDVDEKELDQEQKAYLRTNVYLRWGDRLFWQKLRFALPNVNPDEPALETILLNELEY